MTTTNTTITTPPMTMTTTNTSTTTKVTTRDPCVCIPTTTPSGGRRLSADFERDVTRKLAAHENTDGCTTQACKTYAGAQAVFGSLNCSAAINASQTVAC